MPDTIEAEWVEITTIGARYDEEIDVRADPSWPESRRYRHRPHSFAGHAVAWDGEAVETVKWSPGPAPR